MTDEKKSRLKTAADQWITLAENQPDDSSGRHRAKLYRDTAKSIMLEIETGKPHCACCLKPMDAHKS